MINNLINDVTISVQYEMERWYFEQYQLLLRWLFISYFLHCLPSQSNQITCLIDTDCDIKRRYSLVIGTCNKFESIFKSHSTRQVTKLKIFSSYVGSIFLYSSESWVLTENTCENIDCFQRNFLRKIVKMHWPKVMSNNKLYEKTKQ